jgi:hypothetical protein
VFWEFLAHSKQPTYPFHVFFVNWFTCPSHFRPLFALVVCQSFVQLLQHAKIQLISSIRTKNPVQIQLWCILKKLALFLVSDANNILVVAEQLLGHFGGLVARPGPFILGGCSSLLREGQMFVPVILAYCFGNCFKLGLFLA